MSATCWRGGDPQDFREGEINSQVAIAAVLSVLICTVCAVACLNESGHRIAAEWSGGGAVVSQTLTAPLVAVTELSVSDSFDCGADTRRSTATAVLCTVSALSNLLRSLIDCQQCF